MCPLGGKSINYHTIEYSLAWNFFLRFLLLHFWPWKTELANGPVFFLSGIIFKTVSGTFPVIRLISPSFVVRVVRHTVWFGTNFGVGPKAPEAKTPDTHSFDTAENYRVDGYFRVIHFTRIHSKRVALSLFCLTRINSASLRPVIFKFPVFRLFVTGRRAAISDVRRADRSIKTREL